MLFEMKINLPSQFAKVPIKKKEKKRKKKEEEKKKCRVKVYCMHCL